MKRNAQGQDAGEAPSGVALRFSWFSVSAGIVVVVRLRF